MSQIFISYRRNDEPAAAGRIYDALASEYGADGVFKDVDRIKPGQNFEKVIRASFTETATVIAVIGNRWEGKRFLRKPRLFDQNDWVRTELVIADHAGIPVIPILIDRSEFPAARALPRPLRFLTEIHAPSLRHERWNDDLSVLLDTIRNSYSDVLPESPISNAHQLQGEGAENINIVFRVTDIPELARLIVQEIKKEFPDTTINHSDEIANTGVAADAIIERLRREIHAQTSVVALIGPQWLSASSVSGERRLDQRNDYVRLSLETAFQNSAHVLPVVVDGAGIPSPEAIPGSLRPLTGFNALRIDSGAGFDQGLRLLVQTLQAMRLR